MNKRMDGWKEGKKNKTTDKEEETKRQKA